MAARRMTGATSLFKNPPLEYQGIPGGTCPKIDVLWRELRKPG